jgi:hypothetical protein
VSTPKGEEQDAWLYGLRALVDCMRRGSLREATVTLAGDADAQDVVVFVLGKLGIGEARVSRTSTLSSRLECRVDLPHAELTPRSIDEPGTLEFVVARRRVAAMAFQEDNNLE